MLYEIMFCEVYNHYCYYYYNNTIIIIFISVISWKMFNHAAYELLQIYKNMTGTNSSIS